MAAPRLSGRCSGGYSDCIDADQGQQGAGSYIPMRRGVAEIRAELDDMEMRSCHSAPCVSVVA